MSPIVERIQMLIAQNNDTAAVIFEEIGIRKNALSEWKKGKGSPSVDAIIKIAQHYKVSTDFLLLGIQTENNLTQTEQEWLTLYSRLTDFNRIECTGFVKGYIAAQKKISSENNKSS